MKPKSQKNSKDSKTKLQTVITLNDFDFIIIVVSDALEDILQRNEAKKETMYNCEGYNRSFTLAVQCPLHPLHYKKHSWVMSLPKFVD